ncbi:phosphotransferase [uncultured Amnibacterium sp.]|uniref:phosphotransferase n=1 Tax=uncultured Amnibacterium sp. TaxID=1631851 RepID=UPI0035C99346
MPDEERLSGGNWNAPVRRGAAVHRESGPWSASVHALLRHVRGRGIDWLPEPLGFDEQGREVLSFLPGDVPQYPMPDRVWSEAVLLDAGRRLRDYHDACGGFPMEGRIWQQPAHEPVEVVCHNDFAPYNFVFRGDVLVGVIDVDQASPGPRLWDLAYLGYRLIPLADPSNPDLPVFDRATLLERLDLLCGAYGDGADSDSVLHILPARLRELADSTASRAGARPELGAHADLYRRDAAWVERELLDAKRQLKDRPSVRTGRSPGSGGPDRERAADRWW